MTEGDEEKNIQNLNHKGKRLKLVNDHIYRIVLAVVENKGNFYRIISLSITVLKCTYPSKYK